MSVTSAVTSTASAVTSTAPAVPRRVLTGAEAAAQAMRQIDPDVVPVYPITPQTPIIETFAGFVAEGQAGAELINVESEHSAMSAALGAALAGARTMTATSSQGLALMIEVVYIAASMRAPIVMAVGNRALAGPVNIHCDHSDSMLARDSGVVQLYVENAQEAYDFMILATRLAEHADVRLPVMIAMDGFTITHSAEPVALLEDAAVHKFIGDYRTPLSLLDIRHPTTQGPLAMPDYYFELKRQQAAAVESVCGVWDDVAGAFATLSGRSYGLIDAYRVGDADRCLVLLGSTAGTVKDVVDELRGRGERVGLLTLRAFRPFPALEVRRALARAGRVAVLDRALSPGGAAPLFAEVAAALYGGPIALRSYVYGLGGRDLELPQIRQVYADLRGAEASVPPRYLGLRE